MGPLRHRDRLPALGWLPDHLARLVLDPLALGPLLSGISGLFLFELALALDVDSPAREPRGQAGVLPFLADCQRELVIAHDHRSGPRLLVEPHLSDACG